MKIDLQNQNFHNYLPLRGENDVNTSVFIAVLTKLNAQYVKIYYIYLSKVNIVL